MPMKACGSWKRFACWPRATAPPPSSIARGWCKASANCSMRQPGLGRPAVSEAAGPSSQRTIFDDVLALLTRDCLLHDPRATGDGVAVCVVDSGVERALLESKF